ncbi:nucleotidyl transferase AbiEii/AbiGii toxin family protein [Candidatus Peregrinibacteria bacterium]|nr:nucleotidyl transferase AbiEii/AbiGii toxin family protein [Candidatus Peregrinibacteria bacterium]
MDTAPGIKSVKLEDLYFKSLPPKTKKAFLHCMQLDLFKYPQWYLAGGTALALQEGHRQSVDLDFFSTKSEVKESVFERQLLATGRWKTGYLDRGTIYGTFEGAKMSLIAYPFFIPSNDKLRCGKIIILSSANIAAMKIVAIGQRGCKRDFVDLYWYCTKHERLSQVIEKAVKQYPGQERNIAHILKSLTYFDDADHEPMPKIFFKASWKGIKLFFQKEVKKIARDLLKLN